MAVVRQGTGVVTDRLVEKAGAALEGRTSRRGLLARAALVGSALSVSPLRYLLRPTTAWGVISPGGCSHGLCNDGYTAFCCEINHGSRRLCREALATASTFPGSAVHERVMHLLELLVPERIG